MTDRVAEIKAALRVFRNALHDAVKRDTEMDLMDADKITPQREKKAREAWAKVEQLQQELHALIEAK
jgi:hypothetical protein